MSTAQEITTLCCVAQDTEACTDILEWVETVRTRCNAPQSIRMSTNGSDPEDPVAVEILLPTQLWLGNCHEFMALVHKGLVYHWETKP